VQKNNIDKIKEISHFLDRLNPVEALDILHFMRIQFADNLKEISEEIFRKYKEKLDSLSDYRGVYLILMVDYVGDAILYVGKTSGKSKTSGLRFRLRDHTKLLGKTPLTLFIPNWWIKRMYPIPISNADKAKELEEALWAFIIKNAKNKSHFHSLEELEGEISKVINKYIALVGSLNYVELQTNKELRKPFTLKCPPAGQPRYLVK